MPRMRGSSISSSSNRELCSNPILVNKAQQLAEHIDAIRSHAQETHNIDTDSAKALKRYGTLDDYAIKHFMFCVEEFQRQRPEDYVPLAKLFAVAVKEFCVKSVGDLGVIMFRATEGPLYHLVENDPLMSPMELLPIVILGNQVIDVIGVNYNVSLFDFMSQQLMKANESIRVDRELSYYQLNDSSNGWVPEYIADLLESESGMSRKNFYLHWRLFNRKELR